MDTILTHLATNRSQGTPRGITSICSAHPWVIEAALLHAREAGSVVLIEATCNQVNQEGGYTGMTPVDFRNLVWDIAGRVGFGRERLILGGDHLGPNPWKSLEPAAAMERAEAMVEAYAAAGFQKLHLDCSMGCAGEPAAPGDEIVAERAAKLAARAELVAPGLGVYVIGTEVPTPGGATEGLDHMVPTAPDAVLKTHAIHEAAFRTIVPSAWERVIAMVVQPGVEFGHDDVAIYSSPAAQALSGMLDRLPGIVFEAHSTDYQPEDALRALVKDGYPILKVGPELTFALREALYALDNIDAVLEPNQRRLPDIMDALMLHHSAHWQSHYSGPTDEQRVLRHFSYSDRIRYYWPDPEAVGAVAALKGRLDSRMIPPNLIRQFLPQIARQTMLSPTVLDLRSIAIEAVKEVLRRYERACNG